MRIIVEGTQGCGKTLVADLIEETLARHGYAVARSEIDQDRPALLGSDKDIEIFERQV